MKTFVVLLLIVLSTATAAEDKSSLKFYYCIHAERNCEDTTAKEVEVISENAQLMHAMEFQH